MWFRTPLLLLLASVAVSSSGWKTSAFPKCHKCAWNLGKLGAIVRTALNSADSMSYDLCALNPREEDHCLRFKDASLAFANGINNKIFPSLSEEVSRTLSCSHVLTLCADRDVNGNELPRGAWSCESCTTLLETGLSVLRKPLEEINKAAAKYFCGDTNPECESEFSDILQITGVMGKLIREKKRVDDVCRNVMKCE